MELRDFRRGVAPRTAPVIQKPPSFNVQRSPYAPAQKPAPPISRANPPMVPRDNPRNPAFDYTNKPIVAPANAKYIAPTGNISRNEAHPVKNAPSGGTLANTIYGNIAAETLRNFTNSNLKGFNITPIEMELGKGYIKNIIDRQQLETMNPSVGPQAIMEIYNSLPPWQYYPESYDNLSKRQEEIITDLDAWPLTGREEVYDNFIDIYGSPYAAYVNPWLGPKYTYTVNTPSGQDYINADSTKGLARHEAEHLLSAFFPEYRNVMTNNFRNIFPYLDVKKPKELVGRRGERLTGAGLEPEEAFYSYYKPKDTPQDFFYEDARDFYYPSIAQENSYLYDPIEMSANRLGARYEMGLPINDGPNITPEQAQNAYEHYFRLLYPQNNYLKNPYPHLKPEDLARYMSNISGYYFPKRLEGTSNDEGQGAMKAFRELGITSKR